ncbi:alpha/beta fold hydrolase [Aestuariivita boseongensis]|uniref:alpha/beta fold hydrolase n=1 Tax=Aestuariivita boseongensis TaxID=1470562 RepID=UPI000682779F|nr:alpha/beta hydrolase [Aestuariivita boseongensis]
MPDLSLPDITLHYEVEGSGPPLILLAGMLSDSASWTPLVEALAQDFTVIRPDNRTTGRTTPWDAPVSIKAMAEDARALMAHLGHDRFHVAGHSMGGRMALELYGLAPDQVASISILASGPHKLPRSLAVFDALLAIRQTADGERLWLKALYPWVFAPAFFENPENTDMALEAALNYPHAQTAKAMAHQIEILRNFELSLKLEDVTCPVQVLYAEDDALIPPGPARIAFEPLPNAEHYMIPNAGHSIHWDAPEAVIAQLRGFLASRA